MRLVVQIGGLWRDVVEVDPLFEQLVEEVVQQLHGDNGSRSDLISPMELGNSFRRKELVGATGFEPATP